MKPLRKRYGNKIEDVTPCVGVWIETNPTMKTGLAHDVTPCVGVWIETSLKHELEP